jgi:hypothetical protein
MGCFQLRLLEAAQERRRQIAQWIHAHGLHMDLFFLPTRKRVTATWKGSGVARFHPPLNGTGLPAPLVKFKET